MALANRLYYIFFVTLFFLFNSCTQEPPAIPADMAKADLIPYPVSLTATGSSFALKASTKIQVADDAGVKAVGEYLADKLRPATGLPLTVEMGSAEKDVIQLALGINDPELGPEGYRLEVTEDRVHLTANEAAGLFRGVQTIRQLLPAQIEAATAQTADWIIPTGNIKDYPSYVHRGSMLDVSRHFFGVEDVKRYIDFLAFYKMNVMHLHLTDDQGWRIEIKSWPKLTTHGGSTEVGGGEGGFFTQEQYKELVAYAQARHITVIPEIDMPGHTNAALAAYAELNCDGKARELYTGTEVGFSTLCTDKPITYQFIDDVIRELAAMTPGPYIHIGGDESHATKKEDYIPFVNQVQDIVNKHGKQMIGWDEVATASLKPNSIAQVWASVDNAKLAVEQNAKILMSPARKIYLDMQYDSTTTLGLHWAAYIEIDSSYIWDPATYIPGVGKDQIIGIEAPLWSETVTKMDEIEYMVFPRLPGHAEIGWTPAASRNWDTYKQRLGQHGPRMSAMEIDFYRSKQIPWAN